MALSNANYLTANLLESRSSVITSNGSNKCAETDFGYDDPNRLVGSGVIQGHGAAPSSVRGNITSITRQFSATPCQSGTWTSMTPTFHNVYDTGELQQSIDPLGHTTTYTYSPTYYGAYVTQTQFPDTGSIHHIIGGAYDFNTGVLTSFTDQNNLVSNYGYDSMLRLTSATHPDGGQTTVNYNDSRPPTAAITKKLNSNVNLLKTALFDGLGRTVQTQVNSDPSYTATTYDGLGHVARSYNPTRCAPPTSNCGELTWGFTQYSYDALGRPLTTTNPDGSTVIRNYIGRAAQVQDEGNGSQRVTRISQVDGLGRVTSVCEVASGPFVGTGGTSSSSLIGSGGTPTACGQDIGGTGFLTTYQLDALNNLLQVNQSGIGPRRFSYDSLSRIFSATNPESGTTCYGTVASGVCQASGGYDADDNLIKKTDARGITTTLGYDALNRLQSKSYSDGTPGVMNTYDVAVDGLSLAYPVGRITKSATNDGKTATVNSYDQMGRIQNQYQCTPANCGTGYFSLPYLYDFAGDVVSAGNGTGTTFGYGYNGAAELISATSSLSDANHPLTLFTNATYSPFGTLVFAKLGNGVNETHSYNNRLWLQSISATNPVGGTATAGSGSVTVSGTEQNKQVQTQSAAPGRGSVTIYDVGGNVDQSTQKCTRWLAGGDCQSWTTIYDSGTVSITINGVTSSVAYSTSSNDQNLATGLASAINGNASINSLVSASPSGAVITITAKQTGAQTNYSLSATSKTNQGTYFSEPSFFTGASGSSLTGGQNAAYSTTYDSGTVSITINPNGNPSYTASYNYGQGDNAMSVANGLVSALGPSPVHGATNGCVASSTSCTITLAANTTGYSTNYPVLTPYASSNGFSPSSFSASGSNMSGGTDDTLYNLALSNTPNGNVQTANDTVNGNWNYGYDPFNRLVGANQNSGAAVYSYVYDISGNRWQQNGPQTMTLSFTGNATTNNNRADGYSYDLAGNLLNDGTTTYTYDAENRMTSVFNTSGGWVCYLYNAEGQRVRKDYLTSGTCPVPGTKNTYDYLLDLGGHTVSITKNGALFRNEIYAGNHHLAMYTGGTTYFSHTDQLGTERVLTSVTGTSYDTCASGPFGDGLTCSVPDPSAIHFTGQQRDSVSNLDDFGARYYSSTMGRFASADWSAIPTSVPYADFRNPQSLNLYSYVLDNPATRTDPNGHWPDAVTLISYLPKIITWAVFDSGAKRVQQGVKGAAQISVGAALVGGTVASTRMGPVATATTALAGLGTTMAGAMNVVGAISGKKDVGKAADAVETVTSPAGYVTTLVTGDLEAGHDAATLAGLVTGAAELSEIPEMSVSEAAGAISDFASNLPDALEVFSKTAHELVDSLIVPLMDPKDKKGSQQ
jgi:RHS repeat-associated protein